MKKYKIGYTSGVFDMFHIGHLNVLKNAKERCEYLVVGVSTDELVKEYKNKVPVIPYEERSEIVAAIRYVDKVVPQVDMNKLNSAAEANADAIFVGDDWKGTEKWNTYEKELNAHGIDVVYLPHTDGISSTMLTSVKEEKIEE
ncbi:MAG: adenylyltransferase/cytidyltransferase family protein [Clostridia bacterium]|nr:adenylyltransferase/cytidyltransferase family protein [Clostridia bacterium]